MSPSRLLVLLPLVAACSANVVGTEATDAETSAVTGVVVVEETAFAGDTPHAEVSARFVKVHGPIDDGALRLAGAQLVMPPLGECTTLVDEPLRATRVELLNVGALDLESASGKATLQPRRVPDVTDLVSGVLYTARTDGLRGSVRLHAAGAEPDIAPLVVEAQAPAALTGLRVAGVEAKSAEAIAIPTGTIELEWDAGTDLVYVDILAQGSPSALTTRCAFADRGHATLPAPSSAMGTLAVHRLRRLGLAQFERGELRFDLARLVPFSVHAR